MAPTMTEGCSGTLAAPPVAAGRGFRPPPLVLVAIGAALVSFAAWAPQFAAVWRDGTFFDTDDAMRMVQVRALLQGQPWFDMTATGMNPPHGVFLHWSRIVDVPLVALIKLFGLFADDVTAERLARLTFPFALLVGLYLSMARLATILIGPAARFPTIAATLISGNGIGQFLPGRVDHHAPQIVTLVVMLGAALAALAPDRSRHALLAGLLAGLSLSISLENLPFIAGLGGALALIWVWRGATMDRMLAAYAAGLGLGLPLFFALTVAPARYGLAVCDAFGPAHLGAGLIVALGFGAASLASAKLASPGARLAAMTCVATIAGGFVALVYPSCLHSPFAAVDPLVREIWLDNVEEALPFLRLLHQDPDVAWTSIVPVALGLAALLVAAWWTSDIMRTRFLVVAAVVAIGLAMAFWQIRVFTSVTAIALCGGVFVALAVCDWCKANGRDSLAALSLLLVLPFTPIPVAWARSAMVPPRGETPAHPGATASEDCLAPRALVPLDSLPPGAAVAPIDAGSYLLAQTGLSVFAAAYHRNNDGMRFALDVMTSPPATARRLAASRGVAYVLTCPSLSETARLAVRNPDGLAAALLAARNPSWLTRISLPGTPYAVFRVDSGTVR